MELSQEAIIGVVGVIVPVLVAMPGLTFLAWRWRKRQLDRQNSEASNGMF
jgi:uncharacterized membrane protein YbaN (DUF454 family)